MASDASERGGGFVMARRLTDKGIKAWKKAEKGDDQVRSGILLNRYVFWHWWLAAISRERRCEVGT